MAEIRNLFNGDNVMPGDADVKLYVNKVICE
jgi:hypothetical protein